LIVEELRHEQAIRELSTPYEEVWV
jgi:hypothetical protein